MQLRLAAMTDARLQYEWANDMRPVAINTDPIPWDAHLRWMASVIADPRRTLYMSDVGSVRFDAIDLGWEVSIVVAPEARGQGLGRRLLDAGLAAHGPGLYLARVKPDNQRSLALFRHWEEIEPTDTPIPLRQFVSRTVRPHDPEILER